MITHPYRTIVHVDMDAFFAAVEQADDPCLIGKPVIIGADPKGGSGRGVVSTASYEARRFGVKSAMPISEAFRRCPTGIFISPRMKRYSEVSDIVMEVLGCFSPSVEQISVDEAFLDCTGTEGLFGPQPELALKIKKQIYDTTGLTASVGIASCKSVAKIASDINKPDGITICPFGKEREFLADMPVSKLWGAGPETVKILNSAGFFTIGDIAGGDPRVFEGKLGKMGPRLWQLAKGIDPRPVTRCDSIKSVSEEHTFQRDTADESILSKELRNLSFRVSERSRNAGVKGRTVSIKIRLEGFETYTRSVTLERHVNDTITINQTASSLYNLFERGGKKVRLIGVKLSNLPEALQDEPVQMELFNESSSSGAAIIKQEKIEEVIDSVNIRCRKSLTRASFMKKN